MPTVILLDVSLSMCRSVQRLTATSNDSSGETIDAKQLANVGIGTLLDYLAQNAQLENTALIVFSSLWEIRHQFTRHHESIKNGIYDLELYDKSNIINAVRGALSLKLDEWSQSGTINIILITDGQLDYKSTLDGAQGDANRPDKIGGGGGSSSERQSEEDGEVEMASEAGDDFHDVALSELEEQFNFPCKIQVVCLASPKEPALNYSMPFYKNLISTIDSSVSQDECPVIIGTNVKNFKQSALWLPQSETLDISIEAVESLFYKIAESHYKPYHTSLVCGHLGSTVMVSPKPTACLLEPLKNEFDDLKSEEQSSKEKAKETFVSATNKACHYKLNDAISVCGFMPINDIASPSVISRHLVLPVASSRFDETQKAQQILSQDPLTHNHRPQHHHQNLTKITSSSLSTISLIDETLDADFGTRGAGSKNLNDSETSNKSSASKQPATSEHWDQKQPNFCLMLYNGLKQENMVAICLVGNSEELNEDWYGMLHAHTDTKKRSSLMLSLLIPGPQPVLWLPKFKQMGSALLSADLPQSIRDKINYTNRGPVKSYSSNNVIWLDPESVQADVQKIVRHAKRSPDKAPHFYKELNRIRRAAISYGFYDVLFGLAAILERERRVMTMDASKVVNEETLNHIDHVIACLRDDLREDSYESAIVPRIA